MEDLDRALGIDIGKLQNVRDFNLIDPTVAKLMKQRYGEAVPMDEPVISPSPCSILRLSYRLRRNECLDYPVLSVTPADPNEFGVLPELESAKKDIIAAQALASASSLGIWMRLAGRNREGEDRLGSCKAIRCLLMSPIRSITLSGPR